MILIVFEKVYIIPHIFTSEFLLTELSRQLESLRRLLTKSSRRGGKLKTKLGMQSWSISLCRWHGTDTGREDDESLY